MEKLGILAFTTTLVLSGCAFSENACEDVTLASEQVKQCQALQRQISNAKGKPLIRTELERRYQDDCIDVRYYRDGKQAEICANKKEIGKKSNNNVKNKLK